MTLIDQSVGLLANDNRFCFKDSEGFLWFSSLAGLHRFDGNQIIKYLPSEKDTSGIVGQNVNGLFFEDKLRNIWFSTSEAINCYVRKKDAFISFHYPGIRNGVYFTCGLDNSDQLWLYCDSLLLTFDIHQHTFNFKSRIMSDAQRAMVHSDPNGQVSRVFVYSYDRAHPGFQMFDFSYRDTMSSNTYLDGINEPAFPVRDLYLPNDTLIWIASHKGLISFQLKTNELKIYNPFPDLENIYINGIERMNDSLLLLTSYSKGVFTFNVRTTAFSNHYQLIHHDQVITDPLQALYVDPDRGVWISISGTGIAYYHPQNLVIRNYRHLLKTSLSNSAIHPNAFIELNDHRIWGTSYTNGGFILKNEAEVEKQFYRGNPENWPAENTLLSVIDRKDRIWVLTANQPCVRYPDDHVTILSVSPPVSFNTICESLHGFMILGTMDGGLYKSVEDANSTLKLQKIQTTNNPGSFTFLYSHTDGKVYGSVYESHVEVYDPELNFILVDTFPFKADVQCMVSFNDEQNILIGTDHGLYKYNPDSRILDSLKWTNEISDLLVFGIVPVDKRNVWISTNNGIFSLDMENKSYSQFGIENGSGSLFFNRHAFLHRSNGEIWFGSNDGITVINPRDIEIHLPVSQVNITKLWVNNEDYQILSNSPTAIKNLSTLTSIKLPFKENTISLEFAAINYSGINQSQYEYRMIGSEEKWVHAGNHGIARYANLPAGHYTFQVRATGKNMISESPIRSLHIYIVPPLYQRWWFVFLYLISIIAILFLIYQGHEKRKQKFRELEFEKRLALETERLRIANDMHDDLGSGLSALSLRARILTEMVEKPEVKLQLKEFENNASRLTQQIRETIWTINSKNDNIDNLVTRLHQYAQEYFGGTNIICTVGLMQERITTSIPGHHRREIYLAYKEALHNIYKHAHASEVNITIERMDAGQLVIKIHDNGKGFGTQKNNSGTGLQSMHHRMDVIGGQFQVNSDSLGTLIKLSYPI